MARKETSAPPHPQSMATHGDIVKAEVVELCRLQPNKGQIPGVPKNPRFIRDDNFRRLCKSIEDDPEMTELRELLVYPLPASDHYVVIAGNMRFRAMKENGISRCPCKIIPTSATAEQLRAYAAKDNINYGKWDFDIMANEWSEADVAAAGIDIPAIDYETGAEKPEMRFSFTTAQAEAVKEALALAKEEIKQVKDAPAFDNINSNANAFFYIIQQHQAQDKDEDNTKHIANRLNPI